MREATKAVGATPFQAHFRSLWDPLVEAAQAGRPTMIDGRSVLMQPCTIKGVDRWCIHRRDVMLLAAPPKSPKWETRPEDWLLLDQAVANLPGGVDPDVFGDAYRVLRRCAREGRDPVVLGVPARLRRFVLHGNERWLIHRDDVEGVAMAVRGKLPNLRNTYLSPGRALSGLPADMREIGDLMLRNLLDTRRSLPPLEPGGEVPTVRHFLVDGKVARCLRAECRPAFLDAVRAAYEERLLCSVECGGEDEETEFRP